MKSSSKFQNLATMICMIIVFAACNPSKSGKSNDTPQNKLPKNSSENRDIQSIHLEQEESLRRNALPHSEILVEDQSLPQSTESVKQVETGKKYIQANVPGVSESMPNSGYPNMSKSRAKVPYEQGANTTYAPPVSADALYPEPTYQNQESYDLSEEQKFQRVTEQPLSTFSIDVDNASYTNTRRMLQAGTLPPKEAVRLEEFINYFSYKYPQPDNGHPFGFITDLAPCPWNTNRLLLRVAMKGREIPLASMPPMNLVFLIDVSGSMNPENRLPLLKRALKALTEKLRPQDQVSIVVYAGAAGLVLPCTPGHDKITILNALENLRAGGSTAGGQGLELAYKTATEHYKKNGINRIILASDGDFNVGQSSDEAMKKLIEEKRISGVTLTVMGFGMGNLKDSKMETLANHGNGNYFYIDTYEEAIRVLVDRIDGTLYTLAKDVKLQLEFNPAKVKHYRLIGYDNRRLNKEDFNNDKKDAGDLGAGHTVTALYEIVPTGSTEEPEGSVDELKYGSKPSPLPNSAIESQEWLTVKFRYKSPGEETSKLITHVVSGSSKCDKMNEDFKFCASVAAFGMLLKDSEYKGKASFSMIEKMASESLSYDPGGYRAEFVRMVKLVESLTPTYSEHANK